MTKQATFRLLDNVDVAMRDGVKLKTDLWLPAADGAWPVLLQRTPYRKEAPFGSQYISALEFQAALRRGYAIAIQDTRGRYQSDGEFTPFEFEGRDGADTIEWLRGQPFCNGKIGMFGASYVGATQVLALSENPAGLKAIAPQLTTARHGETWMYRGGALELAFLLLWVIEALGADHILHRMAVMPADVQERSKAFLELLQRDPFSAFARLPIFNEAIAELAPYARDWFDPDAISGKSASVRPDRIETNETAMLVVAGWNDIFLEGSIELFEKAKSRWTRRREIPDRLIIGPWSHGNPSDWQGEEWLGYGASSIDLPEENLAFFDSVFQDRPPTSPMVRYFRSGSNSWHAAPDWPLPDTVAVPLFLDCSRATLGSAPGAKASASYVSDPSRPVPTVGGATFLPGLLLGRNSGPLGQSTIELRDDVLVFTSQPLRDDLEVTGLVTACFWVTSSAASCDWTAKLCDVNADGRSLGVVDGILRWTRAGISGDDPVEITVRLGHISRLFKKGHRLRLQIASSNFPRFDRNPQSGVASTLAKASDFAAAEQRIFSGIECPSRLMLPVITKAFPTERSLAGLRTAAELGSS
ncbi:MULTISPECIES: CocE/NonD family hydrolase [Rhizobium]|uniref:CocE/NonD family hydrolase n=1 Tax=Rhizobium TaxID=379 RepID=UPI000A2A2B93|nr:MULTISPECIES: CocE/NonD family hydrolase [Rhizobium]ARQ62105.1 acyl esterase protein [Rhizobium sp. Kim5]PDS69865.1 esterase [Rhizobium phaseoli]